MVENSEEEALEEAIVVVEVTLVEKIPNKKVMLSTGTSKLI